MTDPQVLKWHHDAKARRLPNVPVSKKKLYLHVLNGHGTLRQAAKLMCLECVGFEIAEVAACTAPACPLYRFRPFADEGTKLPITGERTLRRGKKRVKTACG